MLLLVQLVSPVENMAHGAVRGDCRGRKRGTGKGDGGGKKAADVVHGAG